MVHGLRQVYGSERDTTARPEQAHHLHPVLRERLWANQIATQQMILEALGNGPLGRGPDFQAQVVVAACLAAATTAVLTWIENDGTPELPDLMDQAFDTLANCPTARHQP